MLCSNRHTSLIVYNFDYQYHYVVDFEITCFAQATVNVKPRRLKTSLFNARVELNSSTAPYSSQRLHKYFLSLFWRIVITRFLKTTHGPSITRSCNRYTESGCPTTEAETVGLQVKSKAFRPTPWIASRSASDNRLAAGGVLISLKWVPLRQGVWPAAGLCMVLIYSQCALVASK